MTKLLWQPSEQRIRSSNMYRFLTRVNDTYSTRMADYPELWQWSVDNLEAFWSIAWDFLDIKASRPYTKAVDHPEQMPGARFFTDSRLNFAENLLRYKDDRTALIFHGEDRVRRELTYAGLFDQV
ncbi:MAG: acetoacetate--CoA ligase, partial [Desulfobacterales bacterium]|nr:acetoacetate--CoA ligase [Desulfobacterales bacterium]